MESSVTPRLSGGASRLPERYQLKAQAGKGGMGVVYQAVDRETGAQVAVKVLNSRGAIEMARFEQEARVLAELSHPRIVRYSDHGMTPDGSPYIAMEWLDGETLEDRLARGRLGPVEAAQVAQLVLLALSAAHSRDIVHRDIKPGNIFLVGGKLGDIRVLDFGIARRRLDIKRLTRDGATVGTPFYTSPEQARGRADVDGRADIFSLGCVLYEALAGAPPFTGDSSLEVMTKICNGQAPELSTKRPGLPAALTSLVRAMLAVDPTRRPQSAATLAAEFAQLAEGPADLGFPERASAPAGRGRPAVAGEGLMASAMRISRGRRPKPEDEAFLGEIRGLAERAGCTTDRLIDRALLVTSMAAPTPEEQAIRLASLALCVRELEPTAKIAIASGRTTLLGQLPVGPLMERLPLLMDGQAPGTIRLDETTRRLLPQAFRVAGPPGTLLLLGEEGRVLPAPAGKSMDSNPASSQPSPRPRRPTAADN
jgi:eukaryotic-like serine/threonine-protein kinase